MSDIYAGKPFLKLLDSYVLDAIGALDAESDAALRAREPEFHKMFGATGAWRTIVEQRMQFPAGMAGAIREVWEKGGAKFRAAQGRDPDPVEFTRHFVDTNFPH
ncbi:hypothetical protein [Sphingomonas turrisvirgatae]|uniref:Uncharacterized protein n=1 Tax=Sphingomonas turrisvirgatae TaxID=1888892 RepID=A0A1E3LXS3_9SPHN|nr:hypothetical protein [Sphingomonas turrisvirgatae]ODP38546.1 hypothetical protein BFL28_00405 [Sphingomonas turrisvirgatae]